MGFQVKDMKSWEPGAFPFGQSGFRHHRCHGTLQWKVTNFLNILDTALAHLTQLVNSIRHSWPRPAPCGQPLLVPPPFRSPHWIDHLLLPLRALYTGIRQHTGSVRASFLPCLHSFSFSHIISLAFNITSSQYPTQ